MLLLRPTAVLVTALALVACGDSAASSASSGSGGSGGGSGNASGGGDGQGGGPGSAPDFDLSGALAYALEAEDEQRLFKITASGVEVAVDAEVEAFLALRDGGVAVLVEGDTFALRPDGSSDVIGDDQVGETSNGDLWCRDTVFRDGSGDLEELDSPLGDLSVAYLSRDVARLAISDGSGSAALAQVLDTTTDEVHTIDGCNNGSMVALSDALVLLDDCGDLPLMDLATGERRDGGIGSLNGEQIAVSDGAVILSQSCPVDGSGYGLCHVDGTGAVSNLSDATMDPTNMACCGDRNRALASDGENSVVALAEGALAFRRSVGRTGVPVADGQTIVQLSMGANGVAYYIGGDGLDPVLGMIDVLAGSTTTLESTRRYAEVRAVPIGP
jgi:hypothetical protein